MKQALNALETEINTQGRFQVIAILVAARFLVAALVMYFTFSERAQHCKTPSNGKAALILGGIMFVGFVT